MAKKHYNKPIRDRIPEIIQADGREFETEIMSIIEFKKALLAKLIEEAQEVAEADDTEMVKELADLQEVIRAIIDSFEIDPKQVNEIQEARAIERGGFQKRIKLLWTE